MNGGHAAAEVAAPLAVAGWLKRRRGVHPQGAGEFKVFILGHSSKQLRAQAALCGQ